MPWEHKGVTEMREEFIAKLNENIQSISQLCKDYNITRRTAYKWIKRFSKEGVTGLHDRSRRPARMPTRTKSNVLELIITHRDNNPSWGAKKLKQTLSNAGHKNLPSVSTFNRILRRENRVSDEASEKGKHFIRFEREYPNELWQMDFKGHFELVEGKCYPLTMLDDCSRFSLCLKACSSENELVVRQALEKAFSEYGLPAAMTMDNGSPWKGYPGQRLSSLTVWLMRLGIKVSHSRPYHPQTQGKNERFHRTFKQEVLKYHNFQSLHDAQKQFDEWRKVYNNIRPHEALQMQCPAQKYRPSERHYGGKLPPIEYRSSDEVKRVGSNGEISFKGSRIYIGSFLKGEYVALRERKDNGWDIYYVESWIGGLKNNEKVYTIS